MVLVVEDDPDARATAAAALEFYGYRVLLARNGQEGLDHARRDLPALILMDIEMPVMDGITAARRLRATTSTRKVPVVAVTAQDRHRLIDEPDDLFDDWLTKPVTLGRIMEVVRQYAGIP